jgi:hypothetical protein
VESETSIQTGKFGIFSGETLRRESGSPWTMVEATLTG